MYKTNCETSCHHTHRAIQKIILVFYWYHKGKHANSCNLYYLSYTNPGQYFLIYIYMGGRENIIQLPSMREPIQILNRTLIHCRITRAYFKTHHYFLLVFLLQMVLSQQHEVALAETRFWHLSVLNIHLLLCLRQTWSFPWLP